MPFVQHETIMWRIEIKWNVSKYISRYITHRNMRAYNVYDIYLRMSINIRGQNLIVTTPTDGQAPIGAKPWADTVMTTKLECYFWGFSCYFLYFEQVFLLQFVSFEMAEYISTNIAGCHRLSKFKHCYMNKSDEEQSMYNKKTFRVDCVFYRELINLIILISLRLLRAKLLESIMSRMCCRKNASLDTIYMQVFVKLYFMPTLFT